MYYNSKYYEIVLYEACSYYVCMSLITINNQYYPENYLRRALLSAYLPHVIWRMLRSVLQAIVLILTERRHGILCCLIYE